MAAYIVMAMTNAAAGREDAYNRWLDEVHIPEVLAVPGFESVQRYELTDAQRAPVPHPYRYAAVYEVETDDLPATLAALGVAVTQGRKTDTNDPSRRAIWVFAPRGSKRPSRP